MTANEDAELDDLMLHSMGPAPEGGWQVTTTGAHEVVLAMASSMAEMLDEKDAENYVEAEFKPAGKADGFVLNVRRKRGKTPHQLRQIAEKRIEELEAELRTRTSICRGGGPDA